jgi:hypothetical protein
MVPDDLGPAARAPRASFTSWFIRIAPNADGLGSGAGLRCKDAHTEETQETEAEWLAATDPGPMLEF